MTSVVDWTEPQEGDLGVDQLGMRVAGERAYGALIDFTTTVTWRPRYLSYLCWSLRRAWRRLGGKDGFTTEVERVEIDRSRWRKILKRADYVLAAATLSVERDAAHVAGSNKVNKALDAIGHDPAAVLSVADNHLAARTGSHEIYLGILRGLGLVTSAQGIDLLTTRGEALADAFQESLALAGGDSIFDVDFVARESLERVGAVCSVDRLAPSLDAPVQVSTERRLLREQVVDWAGFDAGRGATSRRILSIGLLLAIFRLYGRLVTLDDLRTTVMLDAALLDGGIAVLDLPHVYDEVRACWRFYQAHAYATYALEALLGVVLANAFVLQGEREGAPYPALLDEIVRAVTESSEDVDTDSLLPGWPSRPLGEVLESLDALVSAGRKAARVEPELHQGISQMVKDGDANDLGRWAHDASLLLLLSTVRLRRYVQEAPSAWIGDNDPQRLPPERLVEHTEASVAEGRTAGQHIRIVLHELVVRQHQRNALRKLAADPSKFTAKLTVEAGLLIPLLPHHPGTSNPRFSNAVVFLQDLGYLSLEEPVTITEDGEALMAEIVRRSAS